MSRYAVIIRIDNYYQKIVEANSPEEAKEKILAEDSWGDPQHDWINTSCGSCEIEAVEDVTSQK